MSQTTITGENRFVVVAPMFNASATLTRFLHSIVGQSYENWKIILIDDVSNPRERSIASTIIGDFKNFNHKAYSDRIFTCWNSEKLWEVANVLKGLNECEDNDIVCRIDADDWLTDLDAFAMIDAAYQSSGCDLLWTAHRWGFTDKNISGPMSDGANVYQHPWVSSHLKTFRKSLLNDVPDVNYRGFDGEYVKRAGDQAIYLPALHNSKKRVFLPRVLYHYTIDDVPATYQTPDAHFQRDEAIFLRQRGYVSV